MTTDKNETNMKNVINLWWEEKKIWWGESNKGDFSRSGGND